MDAYTIIDFNLFIGNSKNVQHRLKYHIIVLFLLSFLPGHAVKKTRPADTAITLTIFDLIIMLLKAHINKLPLVFISETLQLADPAQNQPVSYNAKITV